MFKAQKGVFLITTAGFLAAIVLGFQNCSQTKFTEASGASILKTEAADADTSSAGDDGSMPDVPDHPSQANNGGKKDHPNSGSPVTDVPDDSVESADIVECQMLHPNRKIILGAEIVESPSNASSSRVCMSRNACLELVNAYAARHDCSLATGAGHEADPQLQCTEIFPGSRGTCHNAKILSDDEVAEILNRLASK
jgi:hypothetical protein